MMSQTQSKKLNCRKNENWNKIGNKHSKNEN